MISGIAFDCHDRLSRLKAFPYDRFKIYTIVPIVRVAFPYDPSDRLYIIWDDWDDRAIRMIIWKPGFMEGVNKRRRIFLSLSKLECCLQEINS